MKQQINLITGFKTPLKPTLSAELILKLAIGLVLICAVMQIHIIFKKQKIDEQYESLAAIQALRANELAKLSAQLPDDASADQIRRDVENLTQNINRKSSLLNILDRENDHFSDYMRALAKRTVSGLWLKEIHINQKEKALALLGRTLDADLVTHFLAELAKEPIFARVEFKQLKLAKPADKTLSMAFALRTIPDQETVYIFPEDIDQIQQEAKDTNDQQTKGGIISTIVHKLKNRDDANNGNLPSLADVLKKAKQ